MASNRINRINEEIQKELSNLIRTLKDPRVSQVGMVSVIRVDTTGDLRYRTGLRPTKALPLAKSVTATMPIHSCPLSTSVSGSYLAR